ncbi:hypothetical protein LguiB_018516 [Lonicera macranthoides]
MRRVELAAGLLILHPLVLYEKFRYNYENVLQFAKLQNYPYTLHNCTFSSQNFMKCTQFAPRLVLESRSSYYYDTLQIYHIC